MKNTVKFLSVISCIGVATFIIWSISRPTKHDATPHTLHPTIEKILKQVSATNVHRTFRPVIITAINAEKTKGVFLGSGVLFEGKNGPQVLSARHVFPPALGTVFLAATPIQKGATSELSKTVFVEKFDTARALIPGDLLLCGVGTNMLSVNCVTNEAIALSETFRDTFIPEPNIRYVTSLVSGKVFPVIAGINPTHRGGLLKLVIPYQGSPGESGSGFLDGKEHLYIQKGDFPSGVLSEKLLSRFQVGTNEDLTVLIGPLELLRK